MGLTPRERAWRRRGIDLDEDGYAAMYEAQHGRCKLCGRPPSPRQALAPDHDHKTGRTRGLVCWECNRLILGTLDHYGPARRRRVITRLAWYYGLDLGPADYLFAEFYGQQIAARLDLDEQPEPPPFAPDPDLIGYIEDGQRAA